MFAVQHSNAKSKQQWYKAGRGVQHAHACHQCAGRMTHLFPHGLGVLQLGINLLLLLCSCWSICCRSAATTKEAAKPSTFLRLIFFTALHSQPSGSLTVSASPWPGTELASEGQRSWMLCDPKMVQHVSAPGGASQVQHDRAEEACLQRHCEKSFMLLPGARAALTKKCSIIHVSYSLFA